ncbi:uncharacterized protein LOC143021162 [Oratosquilla oratoria]|uniref:uncharacterized protein LOC143021162 n=1 Tax=Oratosquilla oratoria TaxID=337810 RepID=UPI003F771186
MKDMSIRLNARKFNITIVSAHAPTNDADDDIKDEFYNSLLPYIQNLPGHDINVVLGDFNAKVGRSVVWRDGRTFNQIDHVLVSRRFRSSLCNVRSFRGADADTDHFLVCADMKLKIKRLDSAVRDRHSKQFDIDKLKIPQVRDDFCLDLRNRFQALNLIEEVEDNLNINSKWSKVKEALTKKSEEICGYRKKRKEEWFTPRREETVRRRKEDRLRHLGDPSDEGLKAITENRKEDHKTGETPFPKQ